MNDTLDSYLALPPSGAGAGVLVLHAWWGLNDFMRSFCQRLADEGFVTLAPDLYHGKVATTIDEAKQLRSTLKKDHVSSALLSAVERLRQEPRVTSPALGVVGFSLGAHWALWLSLERIADIAAVTVFYGTRTADYSPSRAAYLGHFAGNDAWVASSGVKKLERSLKAAKRPVTFYTYQGTGHWFFEADRPEAFNPMAAELAWRRTVEFQSTRLRG